MRRATAFIVTLLALCAPAAASATTFATVQHASASGSSTAPAATLTTTPVQGDLIVGGFSANQSSATTCPTGYTALTSVAVGSPARTQRLCYKVAGAAESKTLTASITTSQPWVAEVAEYSTAGSTVNAPNESAQANAASTSMTTPTATPTSGLAGLVVGMTGQNSGGVWSAEEVNASTTGVTTEVTKAQNAAVSAALFDKVITSTSGTYNAQATSSVSAAGAGSVAVFTIGTAASGPPVPANVSAAFDLGWASEGSAAPFTKMNEDYLFTLETANGCPEAGCAVWNGTTTYGANALVAYPNPRVAGNNAVVYKSIAAGNLNHQPPNATYWTVSTAGSDLSSGLLSTISSVSSWVSAVHTAGRLAFITIGGASDQNWEVACDSQYQSTFVTNLVNYMTSNGFDGIDIDMEDNFITGQVAPVTAWTNCASAIADAAHAATIPSGKEPIVTEDIITNWEGPWVQPYQAKVDQFNLMTYGDTCTTSTNCPNFASDASATTTQLCPGGGTCNASVQGRYVLGLDMSDFPLTESSCKLAAQYAKGQGFLGAMDWELVDDHALGTTFPCQTDIATGVGTL